jgi:predicted ATPase/DNA-binding winged helix-turn-helix (wHTH) protein
LFNGWENVQEQALVFGRFEVRPGQRLLLMAGSPVALGGRAFDILLALIERAGEVVSKDELISRAWQGVFVEEANLRIHVAALRRALGDGQNGARVIANVPGRGYCFVASVEMRPLHPPPVSTTAQVPAEQNVPSPLTRVIGRAEQVRLVAAQLPEQRLVTLVGPGGIGKTTVALVVAQEVAASFRDGVVFVDLAPINDAALVPGLLAAALALPLGGEETIEELAALLRNKELMIVLDSCEHVIEAAATLVEALLKTAPGVAVLATSAEPLRAEAEWVHRLPPLGFPPSSQGITANAAIQYSSVQLFVERAAAALGGFELLDAAAPAVADICRRLDGIPLAIELAASRVDIFAPQKLAMLLDDRLKVLSRGRRTALPRHRTLRAALDWSYGLLLDPERALLRRLSVFNGGFTLAAAMEVAQDETVTASEVGNLLASLVEKSLVVCELTEPNVRYRLLDTMRTYAREKLDEAGEAESYAKRHAEHLRRVFERAEAEWDTRNTTEWLRDHARQIDDLRAALDWAFSASGDAATGMALAAAAVPLWFQMSLINEGIARVTQALAALGSVPDPDGRRSMRLYAALGSFGRYAGASLVDNTAAWSTALELADRLGDVDYQLRALWALWANQNHSDYRLSLDLARRFRNVASGAPDPMDGLVGERMIGHSLHLLGNHAEAREHTERMLDRYVAPVRRSHVVRFHVDQTVMARNTLARILWMQGFAGRALREVEENVALARSLGHPLPICNALALGACPVALLASDLPAAEGYVAMLRQRASEHALDIWPAYADCYEGELLVLHGDPVRGLALLQPAVDELRRRGLGEYLTSFLRALAQGLARTGDTHAAMEVIEEALARCRQTGETWSMPELLRLRGHILLEQSVKDVGRAEQAFLDSLRAARAQDALSWELRVATSLAELWSGMERRVQACDLLTAAISRQVADERTTDLLRAEALLQDLAASPNAIPPRSNSRKREN